MIENLIDESEFTKPYNPWKRFGVFYGIAGIHIFVFYQMVAFTEITQYVNRYILQGFAIVSVLSPLLIGLVMLLGENKIVAVKVHIRVIAIFILQLLYFFGLVFITVFETVRNNDINFPSIDVFMYMGLYAFANLVITLAIALPLLKIRRKRLLTDTVV